MNTLQAAIRYLKSGVAPIPIWPDDRKNPHLSSTKEYSYRLPSVSDWQRWFQQWPGTNIALITGHWGLCALDFDTSEGYDLWCKGHWDDVCPTWVVQTARGYHVWFKVVGGEIGQSQNYTKDGQEVLARCKGGYCVVPPSIHHSGSHYTTTVNAPPAEIDDITDVLTGWQTKRSNEPVVVASTPILAPKGDIRIEDLVQLVGGHPNGRGAQQAYCPFHDDKTPSAWVNVTDQRFGCNACWPGLWWDVTNVYAMLNNISDRG